MIRTLCIYVPNTLSSRLAIMHCMERQGVCHEECQKCVIFWCGTRL